MSIINYNITFPFQLRLYYLEEKENKKKEEINIK